MRLFVGLVVLLAGVTVIATFVARANADRRVKERIRAVTARVRSGVEGSGEVQPTTDGLVGALAGLDRAADSLVDAAAESDALRRSLSAALEALPLGVVVTRRGGDVVFRNEAADVLLGTGAADALALRAVTDLLAAAASGQAVARPLDLYGPPRRTLSLSGLPLDDGAAAVIVEDVSDRRRLDAVRRDFVANVSHELKTPVAALGLLAETLAGESDAGVVQRLAARMQDEAFRVARIIDDLLDLSRLEAEETARHEPVRLADVVADAVEQVLPAAGLRSIRVAVGDVPRSWSVLGEHRQLVSAVANLLENAVKYSDDGSTVEVGSRTDGTVVELVVRDTGIGIPTRDLDRIFERFYRVDRGRGRDTGGTGLGLSIVRHIASNHGGDVLVESVEGEGSAFTLRLPAAPGPVGLVAEAG